VQTLEQQRKVAASIALVAPIDGVISELGVREGAAFADGALLFRINGLATVWVNAQLPEAQSGRIAAGAAAEIHAAAWPGQTFTGRIEALLPQLDPATRTLTARIAVDNRSGRLAPGMFVSADLIDGKAVPQLWIPSEAVIATGLRSVVIRARDAGAFDAVDVTTGAESGGRTEIISGLAAGETVVISGQFLIDSEASLKSALNRLSVGPSP
jgi:Cu(I)/Ag(I) efflux system membrane fusion protein